MEWKPRKVVVVSGSGTIGAIIAIVLAKKAGMDVETFLAPEDALKYLATNKPDIILLEVWFKEVNLPLVIGKIRTEFGMAGTPIILVDEKKRNPFEVGANVFLGWPFTNEALLSAVHWAARCN